MALCALRVEQTSVCLRQEGVMRFDYIKGDGCSSTLTKSDIFFYLQ